MSYQTSLLLLISFASLLFPSAVLAEDASSVGLPASAPPLSVSLDPHKRHLLTPYQAQSLRIRALSLKLQYLWDLEKELIAERDRSGRNGELASLLQLNRELLQVRQRIDHLRRQLSKENQVLAQLED